MVVTMMTTNDDDIGDAYDDNEDHDDDHDQDGDDNDSHQHQCSQCHHHYPHHFIFNLFFKSKFILKLNIIFNFKLLFFNI